MIPFTLLLLGLAAVYVGTIETAFSALMKLSLRLIAERGRDDRLGYYLDDPIELFVPARLLLGIIFALATVLLAVVTGREGISFVSLAELLACVAVYIFICEHLLPSIIVRGNPEAVLAWLLPPFSVVAAAMSPISSVLVSLMRTGNGERTPAAQEQSEEEAGEVTHAYLQAGEEQGLIEGDEKRLLQSIVDFGDTLVREVMTPRPDIVAVPGDSSVAQLRALFREQEYSRFPVYNENLDNILGIIRVKDLLQIDDAALDRHPITPLIRPATFVPETKRVPELLKEFQRKQVQMAIVVDEYGGTAGLVTIEDLLEEIVGEIRDEDDVESEPIVDEGNGSFTFSAKVSFDELRERLGLEIEPEGFETVGGYILARVGRVPAVGESFELDGMHVEVLEAERRRIHKVRFRRGSPAAPDNATLTLHRS
ncbi:MAG TPA: hemolysin family protein [Vicinamibacterales bacterium]|jgi:CBS domain containing-hemolysin-like protein|nr:hemolysin family protein [Vicinamibacterales bacterium]